MSSSGRSYNVARLANALMTLLHIYGYGCSLTAEPERSVVTDCDVECRPYRQTAPPPRSPASVTNLVCSLWLVNDKVDPTVSSYIQGTAVTSYSHVKIQTRQVQYRQGTAVTIYNRAKLQTRNGTVTASSISYKYNKLQTRKGTVTPSKIREKL